MTLGNFIACIIGAAALYAVCAFVRTVFFHRDTWPFVGRRLG